MFALALLLAACSSDDGGGSGGGSSPSPAGGGTSIVAKDFAFSPDSVDVGAGTVSLTVTNDDSTLHTFTLDDGSSDTDLPPGETVEITLDLSTTVGWHCTIHPSMTGTLNVA